MMVPPSLLLTGISSMMNMMNSLITSILIIIIIPPCFKLQLSTQALSDASIYPPPTETTRPQIQRRQTQTQTQTQTQSAETIPTGTMAPTVANNMLDQPTRHGANHTDTGTTNPQP
jgi:hypothetical protein